jgi:hypothetical protein
MPSFAALIAHLLPLLELAYQLVHADAFHATSQGKAELAAQCPTVPIQIY